MEVVYCGLKLLEIKQMKCNISDSLIIQYYAETQRLVLKQCLIASLEKQQ